MSRFEVYFPALCLVHLSSACPRCRPQSAPSCLPGSSLAQLHQSRTASSRPFSCNTSGLGRVHQRRLRSVIKITAIRMKIVLPLLPVLSQLTCLPCLVHLFHFARPILLPRLPSPKAIDRSSAIHAVTMIPKPVPPSPVPKARVLHIARCTVQTTEPCSPQRTTRLISGRGRLDSLPGMVSMPCTCTKLQREGATHPPAILA